MTDSRWIREFTIGIRGDFGSDTEVANIYINGVYITRCDVGLECDSRYSECGPFSHGGGILTIQVRASNDVGSICTIDSSQSIAMEVYISFLDSYIRGSNSHTIIE